MKVVINGVQYIPSPDVPTDKSLLSALEIRFDSDAGDNITVRDYLYTLLSTLWVKGESFSGKRPFGNSGWEYDVYRPLIANGFIPGKLDEEHYVASVDEEFAIAYVQDLIKVAFYGE